MKSATIISAIPHEKPFLFVDKILEFSDQHIMGEYTFPKTADFFNGHFPEKSVVPGVLLTECAAQIGLACFGYVLQEINSTNGNRKQILLSYSQMDFEQPVEPEERLRVEAELDYFRFHKLSVKVKIYVDDKRIAVGKLQGMTV
jgi:3-hydroxyacyl-[acyl-carrier-protein] dehydratase